MIKKQDSFPLISVTNQVLFSGLNFPFISSRHLMLWQYSFLSVLADSSSALTFILLVLRYVRGSVHMYVLGISLGSRIKNAHHRRWQWIVKQGRKHKCSSWENMALYVQMRFPQGEKESKVKVNLVTQSDFFLTCNGNYVMSYHGDRCEKRRSLFKNTTKTFKRCIPLYFAGVRY